METAERKESSDLSTLQKNISELGIVVSAGPEEVLKSLQGRYETLDSIEREIIASLPSIKREKEKLEGAISALKGDPESVDIEVGDPNSQDTEIVTCGNATVDDIKGCTQRRAMYVIAEKNDGLLPLNSAVDLIVAAKLNRGTRKSSLSTLHHYLSNNQDFVWSSPSKFRLKGDEDAETTTGDEWAQSERVNENSVNGFNHRDVRR